MDTAEAGSEERQSRVTSIGAKKGFGTLIYENTEALDFEYIVISAEESVKISV